MSLIVRARKKGLRHWIVVIVTIVVAIALTPLIERTTGLDRGQDWLFQKLSEWGPRSLEPRYIRLVMIQDDDYYSPLLEHRQPIRRDYLAMLIDELVAVDADIIAVDFDLHIPHWSGPIVPGDMSPLKAGNQPEEVRKFVEAVVGAAENRKVILPRQIVQDADGHYAVGHDIYEPFGICTRLIGDGRWASPGIPGLPVSKKAEANIRCGYIALTRIRRQVPPQLDVGQAGRIDSFSLALARAKNPRAADALGDAPRYVALLPQSVLAAPEVMVSASHIRTRDPAALDVVRRQPVLIGALWRDPHNERRTIDVHDTALGLTNGTMILDSYAEAILDEHWSAIPPEWLGPLFDVLLSLFIAVLFAAYRRTSTKVTIFVASIAGTVFSQWLLLERAGVNFDAIPPVTALFAHSAFESEVDRALDWCRKVGRHVLRYYNAATKRLGGQAPVEGSTSHRRSRARRGHDRAG